MKYKDYYKILGLETSRVSIEEIKAAYRAAVKRNHPDVNVGDSLAEEKIKEINEREKPDKIILLGDLYYHGPRNDLSQEYNPMKVAEILNSLKDKLLVVRGNCDAEVDEMISEFKHKGYLEPLEKNVMTEEVRDSFPQKYLESICEENGHIYSVPFQMDIMMFWVNQELLKQAGLDEIKNTGDFDILQKSLKNPDQYAYGDAWENTHVYNSLSQFVNFWGGDYFDWTDPKTKDAARYMKSMLDEKNTSPAQFVDQYEQMEEKFIRGKYGCVFMYTSALGTFLDADVYGIVLCTLEDAPYVERRVVPCFIRKKPLILQPGSMF